MAQDKALKASVEGVVRNFKVTDRKYFSDGGVELTVEMPLDGKLAELLLPAGDPPTRTAPRARRRRLGAGGRGQGPQAQPALAPRILDERARSSTAGLRPAGRCARTASPATSAPTSAARASRASATTR